MNYYKKSETFTKQEVNDLISAISTLDLQVVQTLPTQDISTTTIYLVPKADAETNDVYDEYIYVSNAWEHIGSTQADLTDYVTNTDYASLNTGGVVKVNASYGINTANTGTLIGVTKDYSTYESGSDLTIIDKGTLENVIDGKGLVSDTDYASFTKPGLIKPSSGIGTDVVSSTGVFYASTLDYATYNSANNGAFVGKGTLENVITGKNLATKSDMPKHYFGTCSTGAATRSKVVECENFVLEEGATISVSFENAQTYNGYPYLNVNNTGNIIILYKGGTVGIRYMWSAGEIIDFTYHNEYWICHGRGLATTTYYGLTKLSSSALSTSTSMATTPAVVNALMENMITGYDAYSASKTYEVGDRVRYSSYSYECITAIPTAESWTPEHWQEVEPLQTQIDDIKAQSTYSTTEQRVGTLIDGKPVYRIYLTGTTQSDSAAITLVTGVDKLVDHEILVKRNNINQYHPLSANMVTNETAHASPLFINDSSISLYITNTAYKNQNFYGWVKYTKTTD